MKSLWQSDNIGPLKIIWHWQLDVTFREDYSKKIQNAAKNFSAATKIALSVLKNDKITKGSMNLKRLKAGWDENYLSRFFTGLRILMRLPYVLDIVNNLMFDLFLLLLNP